MATDSFTGTNGTYLPTYSGNWTSGGGGGGTLMIQNNTAVGDQNAVHHTYWGADSFAEAHYSKVVLSASINSSVGPAIRCTGSRDCFYCIWDTGDQKIYVGDLIDGTPTDWDSGTAGAGAGDEIELAADSTTPTTIYLKINGATVKSFTGKNMLSGGASGVAGGSSGGTFGLESWEGGDSGTAGTAYTITAAQGSYSLTGQTANLARAYVPMTANQGSYGLTGQDATLSYVTTRTLPAEYGLYTLVGSEALVDLAMNAELGEYDLNGQVATLNYAGLTNRTITAEQGSYSLTGQDINMFWAHVLQALQGTYNLTGTSVILRWSEESSAGGIVLVQAITITKLKIGL